MLRAARIPISDGFDGPAFWRALDAVHRRYALRAAFEAARAEDDGDADGAILGAPVRADADAVRAAGKSAGTLRAALLVLQQPARGAAHHHLAGALPPVDDTWRPVLFGMRGDGRLALLISECEALASVAEAVSDRLSQAAHAGAACPADPGRTADEWLMADALPELLRAWVPAGRIPHGRPAFSKTLRAGETRRAPNPALRFVVACLAALGMPKEDAAVMQAIRRASQRRSVTP